MPEQTQNAVSWALTQKNEYEEEITNDTAHSLVEKVREFFNEHGIPYESFCYDDLIPYLA